MSKLQNVIFGVVVLVAIALTVSLVDERLLKAKVKLDPLDEQRDPIEAALNNAVQHLANGKIAFESPLSMKQGETKTVEVRIAKNLNQDITQGLATTGPIKVEDIKVGPLMVATLHGSAFQITRLTKEEQAVTDDNFTAWDWAVRPTDWGEQRLYLSVCVRLNRGAGKEEQRCSPVYDRPIAVQVDPLYAATHFVKDDPKWTIATIGSCVVFLAGCFTGLRQWLKKKKGTKLDP